MSYIPLMPRRLQAVKEELFESVFTYANDGIAIVGLDGKWIKVNPGITKLLGYSEDEMYQRRFQGITHRDDLETDESQMEQLLDGSIDNYQMEKRYFHKNGHVVWVILSVSLVRDDLGEPLYFISMITDISAQKSATWHLQFLMNVVKGQNEKLTDFARIATHDFRTHVGNLGSIVEFMEEDEDTLCETENFKMLKESISNLNDTLKHLNLIRLDKPNSFNSLNELSLYNYITNAIYNVNAIAKKYNCTIINNVGKNTKVWGIEAYLDSIILNFLTNAIKYRSAERPLTIELSSSIDGEYVVLKICDNGLGIDLEANGNKLFTLNGTFHKHKDSRGIGLFITKSHIESIGGKIDVESTVDEGTCFSIYFLKV
ncbi:sensor histidine kinase [Winogradskyella ursingii]|uniref:sensor histidine kinase n=1 Tax=Winogradskyella ursingii TaxID=2686079 RepID=UPI001FE2AE79|nr:HAMP domain-containing sensor histidine kinase [Winogradskyella ursingii]